MLKFMFSKKAPNVDKNLHRWFDAKYLVNVKSMVKIFSILVAFLELYNQIFIASTFPELFSPYMKIGW